MEREIYQSYVAILRGELVPALGCTEPIAIAYASALARKVLGREAERMDVACSGNIIKNVKSVIVPNSGGQYGVETAAILGMLHGDPDAGLEVLQTVTEEDQRRTLELKAQHFCTCSLLEGDENLHIIVTLWAGDDVVEVETRTAHTHVVRVAKNGVALFTQSDCGKSACGDNITRDAIRDNLAKTDGSYLTGPIAFTEIGDIVRTYLIYQIENGEYVLKCDYDYANQ